MYFISDELYVHSGHTPPETLNLPERRFSLSSNLPALTQRPSFSSTLPLPSKKTKRSSETVNCRNVDVDFSDKNVDVINEADYSSMKQPLLNVQKMVEIEEFLNKL